MVANRRGAEIVWPALFCALFIALANVAGYVCSRAVAADGYALHWPSAPALVIVVAALWVASYLLLRALFLWLDKHSEGGWRTVAAAGFFRRHCLIVSAAVIALCWLPYLIIYFPGTLTWDGARSMNQFITDAPLENHHPVLMNLLYAGLMTLGRALYSDNLGLLLIVTLQYAACVAAFAASVRQLVRMEAPRWLVAASLAFFALYPGWGLFAQTAIKDTLFFAVFCWYVLSLLRLMGTARPAPGSWAAVLIASLVLCFTRNNGIYIALPTLLAAAAFYGFGRAFPRRVGRRSARTAVGLAVACAVVYLLVMNVAWPALGINTRENKEMLSIPFQQTARTLLEHPGDATDAERAAIAAVLPYDDLADLYLPDLADPVKESLLDESGNLEGRERDTYFRAWFSMGLRHPATYLRATLANTYAYFYPWAIVGPNVDRPLWYVWMQGEPINKTFQVHNLMPDEVRRPVTKFFDAQLSIPVLSALYSPALYVWAFLVLVTYAFHRGNRRALVLAVPMAMLLLTVLAGPLNGQLRYVLPIACALPLLAGCLLAPAPSPRGKDLSCTAASLS